MRRQPGLRRTAARYPVVAVTAGRAVGVLSRWSGRGRGSTLPGRVGLRLQPDLLRRLARGRTLLLVSGTNGKTTTTRYLAAALATRGPVVTNSTGANMRAGLATTLMLGHAADATVVLEVDERALVSSAAELSPRVVLLLNLTRDQLDRTGEVAMHVRGWAAALGALPAATVVANADDPLVCAAVLTARPDAAGVRWVRAGQPWRQDAPLCPLCGQDWAASGPEWLCAECGFARPASDWTISDGGLRSPDGGAVQLELALPGRANLANAAMAAAAAGCLGVVVPQAVAAMAAVTDVDGRYLEAGWGDGRVCLLLAKNPAGWAEVLAQLTAPDRTGPVVIAVNARDADGRDTSWLWDVPFEQLRGRDVVAAGERSADVALRLRYAGVAHRREPDPLLAARGRPGGLVHVAANYTAFTRVRDRLALGRAPGSADTGLAATA